jgi:hemin uptake protein HemP
MEEKPPPAPEPPTDGGRLVQSTDLLGSERVLRIAHKGEIYVLRLTRNDRLILTK